MIVHSSSESTVPVDITLGPFASLSYVANFLKPTRASRLQEKWISEIPWEQTEITLFGKRVNIPRMNAWYGDKPYAYSGTRFEARPLPAELDELKREIEKASGLEFNSVLANWYRDGQDCMGWHSDDEASLGKDPQIASVSFGDTRRFVLREKRDRSNKTEVALQHGSLILMLGQTQSLWQHCVPRTRLSSQNRLNLTFRFIV